MNDNNQILFQLGCAFHANDFKYPAYVSRGQERINQYVRGFNSFFSLYREHVGDVYKNVIITDNTVKSAEYVEKDILDRIPSEVNVAYAYNESKNEYGRYNKGSGLIEAWSYIKDTIKQYKYIYYHEARSAIENFNLYKTFLEKPQSLFKSHQREQFYSGTFIVESKILLDYLDTISAETMAVQRISIEANMYSSIKEKVSLVEDLGIIWYDQMAALNAGLYAHNKFDKLQKGLERRY